MIRFRCPKCSRESVVSNALAGLPLLCKGCGERTVVPPPGESLPEPPAPPPPPKPVFERSLPEPENDHPDILITPTVDDSAVNLFPTEEARKKIFMPIEGSGQTMPPPDPMPPLPAPEAGPLPMLEPPPAASPKNKSKMIDSVALGVMLVLGVFLGEFATRKSTLQIFSDAPASPKFPPTELLLWLGSVAACGLLYGWLIVRGWSLGPRLTHR